MLSRILIISTNREMSPQPVAPAGAAWIAEALSGAGFDTRLLDLSFEKDPVSRVIKALGDWNPDGIGISVRNADNGDFLSPRSFLPDVKEITDAIKENSSARIIIGGAGSQYNAPRDTGLPGPGLGVHGRGRGGGGRVFQC